MKDDNNFDMYIQIKKDSESPRWEKYGDILAKAFDDSVTDDPFLENCVSLFLEKENE